jgi:hypothetical protein
MSDACGGGEYRYMQVELDSGPVGIIQDTANRKAWIQSTLFVEVKR